MFLFVLVCVMLLVIILLQSSKSGGMGAAISGQSMNDAFGGEGADKLMTRLTRVLAFIFMALAIWIGQMNNAKTSIVDEQSGLNNSGQTTGGNDDDDSQTTGSNDDDDGQATGG